MNFPSSLQLSIGNVCMPFSDDIKYTILGVSALLLAVAIIILVWLVYRYYTQSPGAERLAGREDRSAKKGVYGSNLHTPNMALMAQAVEELNEDPPKLSPAPSCEVLPSLCGGPASSPEAPPSLSFSLQYEQLQARLLLRVLGGPGAQGGGGGVEPRVTAQLLWARPKDTPTSPPLYCVLREWQLLSVTDSADPAHREFSCPLPERVLPHTTVRLQVRDPIKNCRKGVLGEVRAHLGGLALARPLEVQESLLPPRKVPVGEVLLSLKYLPTARRLDVGVLKIRAPSGSPPNHKALYARTSVVCNRIRVRGQKTTQKIRQEMMTFNEVMTFALPGSQVTECSITVSVYEVGEAKKSSKRLIGQVSLRKGKKTEDEHWSQTMQSLRQPIAKWHLLFI